MIQNSASDQKRTLRCGDSRGERERRTQEMRQGGLKEVRLVKKGKKSKT